MKRKSNLLLIILIISSLFLILIPKSVIGSEDDIHYTFENDVLYSNDNLQFIDNWNIRNQTILTDIYNATYSFTNDVDDSEPIGWISDNGVDCTTTIISNLNGHNKVLDIYDNSGNLAKIKQVFLSVLTVGTVEFWISTDTLNNANGHYVFYDSGNTLITYIFFIDSDIYYRSNGVAIKAQDFTINTWYHIKMIFDTGAGVKGQYDLYINDILEASGIEFDNIPVSNELTYFQAQSHSTDNGYHFYLDAIGYSWISNYSIGVNFIPYIQTNTSIKENDVFPFTYENFDTFEDPYEEADTYFDSWNPYEEDNNELSHQFKIGWSSGLVYYEPDPVSDPFGLMKDFDIDTCNTINITWSILIESLSILSIANLLYVFSEDFTELMTIIVSKDAGGIIKVIDTDATVIYSGLSLNRIYSFNLYINLNDDVIELNTYHNITISNSNPTLINTYRRDTENHNQAGLGIIRCLTGTDINSKMYLDYIGVYVDQISLSNQYGLLKINTDNFIGGNTFNLHNHNLLTFDIIGNASIRLPITPYLPGLVLCKRLTDLEVYNGIEQQCIYFKRDNDYLESSPIIFLEIYDYVEFKSLTIEGSKLVQSINEYWLELEQGNINLTESYFYVDIDNKLQFTLITNDTNTEYIQATFNIPNLSTTDRAISFRGFRLNKAYGYFVVDYLAGLTTVDIPIIEKTTRSILPTNKTIDNFIVLITDNDDDVILGSTTGYVSHPILLSISGIGLPIITAGLIEMMIPLLLIMIPTLLISQGFGKEGKKLLIPLFLVFSLIATITEIIPIWIFFIIAFGNSLFLFRNKEIEG